jgi:hypothetical protein
MDASTDPDMPLSDVVFHHLAAQPVSSGDDDRFWAAADQPASADAQQKHTAADARLDPVMAASDALVDPVSHPDAAPADSDKTGSHHAGQPASNGVNGNAPNLAGVGQDRAALPRPT